MAYIYPNFKTKRAAKEAVANGVEVTCIQLSPTGTKVLTDGTATIEGPHYPEPHKWYGKATLKGGRVVKLT